jgi:hypothetical protein
VRAPRLDDHRVDDRTRDDRAIRIAADHGLVDQLLDDDDHSTRRERCLLLHAEQTPDLRIAGCVGALRVHDRDVGVERWHRGKLLACEWTTHRSNPWICAR